MIRAALVEDHEIVRTGIAAVLEADGSIEVIAEASTVAQGLSRIVATRPDVAVLDLRLPDGSGIDLCRDLHERLPALRCIILSAHVDDDAIDAALDAGAAGYVAKNVLGRDLVEAVTAVAAGRNLRRPSSPGVVPHPAHPAVPNDPRLGALTLRERQILGLISNGLTNREVGARLGLQEKTVKNYASHVLRKLGLERRTQAAVLGFEHKDEL
ncbi:response regulator transcription factor [Herbiconiux sp. CPCC 203407]|uniref:Response regulator transcription factor n=1 Tax=Herbiconiux oxytropis TaxID=2970915 RepID=A0AA42BV69_9MICO|nr:response regulator transcription factor [Herbiconiux oxytropis]MCS5724144.1 response regulator transcription factor [Herbiconiux oxytropis]MCS5726921.1 response regulator transcription factor [Herbiconiux oxytropis]